MGVGGCVGEQAHRSRKRGDGIEGFKVWGGRGIGKGDNICNESKKISNKKKDKK